MIARILKNWKTTVIGLVILAVCFALVFAGKATLTEVGGFICGGFCVLFSKDSLLKKKKTLPLLAVLLFVPGLTCCRSVRTFTSTTETVVRDTVRTTDTVNIRLTIKGDTVVKYSEKIVYDTVMAGQLQTGTFSIPPWDTCTDFAYAEAGITDNLPWLRLEQRTVDIDTAVYLDRIRILEQRRLARESQIVDEKAFYEDVWFWIAVCLALLTFRNFRYARN